MVLKHRKPTEKAKKMQFIIFASIAVTSTHVMPHTRRAVVLHVEFRQKTQHENYPMKITPAQIVGSLSLVMAGQIAA